jgi:hypothetical protein
MIGMIEPNGYVVLNDEGRRRYHTSGRGAMCLGIIDHFSSDSSVAKVKWLLQGICTYPQTAWLRQASPYEVGLYMAEEALGALVKMRTSGKHGASHKQPRKKPCHNEGGRNRRMPS